MLQVDGVRKVPVQSRGKARRDLILSVAEAVIAEKGSDAMNMSEVAARAEISIGSLYQYFRDKSSIVGALGLRYHAESTACIEQEFAGVDSQEALRAAFVRLMAIYSDLFRQSPAMRDVWLSIQSDKALRQIEADANNRNGELLAAAMERAGSRVESEIAKVIGFTIMALGESAMRLSIALPPGEGEAVVETYTRMALAELEGTMHSAKPVQK